MSRRLVIFLASLFVSSSVLAASTAEWTDDATIYRSDKYGFSLSYPANWHLRENVKTRYIQNGLPAVFTICLTPGPTKTFACDAELDVIPADQFMPPDGGFFLKFPSQKMDSYSAEPSWGAFRGEPFSVTYPSGASTPDVVTNHLLKLNGYMFLWVDHGEEDTQEPWNSMISSFQFYLPSVPADPA